MRLCGYQLVSAKNSARSIRNMGAEARIAMNRFNADCVTSSRAQHLSHKWWRRLQPQPRWGGIPISIAMPACLNWPQTPQGFPQSLCILSVCF